MKNLKEFSSIILIGYGLICFPGLFWGIMDAETMSSRDGKCTYESLLSRTNLGYLVGCELAKPRFKKE